MKKFLDAIKECMRVAFQSSPFYTIFRMLTSLIQAGIDLVSVWIEAEIINQIVRDIANQKMSYNTILLFLGIASIYIIRNVISRLGSYCQTIQAEIIDNYLRAKFMKISNSVDIEFFDSSKYHDSFEKYKEDSNVISILLWNLITLIQQLVTLIGAACIVWRINWIFAVLIICIEIPSAYLSSKFIAQMYSLEVDAMNSIRRRLYIANLFDNKSFAADIRFYNLGKSLIGKYNSLWSDYFKKRKNVNKSRTKWCTILEGIPYLCMFGMLFVVTKGIIIGKYEIGYYSMCFNGITRLIMSIKLTIDSVSSIYENKLKITNIDNFSNYKSKIIDGTELMNDSGIEIEFRNVSFKYPMTEKQILKNVSFVIERGQHVALIGKNGSGKSTITKLLLRLYDVDDGAILINGRDIRCYELKSLREKISVFFQESNIYGFSLGYNVSMSSEEQDDNKVKESLLACNANDVYMKADKNLDIGLVRAYSDDAVELSGGQRQKVALARTFYRESNLFILDEPSNYLDPLSERQLLRCMEEKTYKKTTIYISHRMATLNYADKILLLDKGCVIGYGTHDNLLENSDEYRELYYS